ncbi:MAG: AhpC/TSA family protein [Caldilineaceae bacterium]
MKELRKVFTTNAYDLKILFVYQGTVDQGNVFFQQLWPEARAVSDPSKYLYQAFGLERASLREIIGPEVAACGIRAMKNGSFGGRPVGDTRMMPGAFLVDGEEILWRHDYRHIADHPDFEQVVSNTAKNGAGRNSP